MITQFIYLTEKSIQIFLIKIQEGQVLRSQNIQEAVGQILLIIIFHEQLKQQRSIDSRRLDLQRYSKGYLQLPRSHPISDSRHYLSGLPDTSGPSSEESRFRKALPGIPEHAHMLHLQARIRLFHCHLSN
ncbi:hypothetical protein FGO68_gene1206 [Halteria grandinella]|uniref:Uncharacterized protein n=1 Tax=Halteria grandinella TaxID=5974 RepID=A0A8J8T2X9_HALGN|nr:hypothetical protein FGO68_gene1206 [Halteria grandinella]